MLRNYFKTALRNLWKNKGFSAINILGLAIGLATCLLILIYVMDELSYDRFNKKADRIVRLDSEIKFGGHHFILAVTPPLAGPSMLQDYPEVEQYARVEAAYSRLVKKGNLNLRESNVGFADSTLFDVFSFTMLAGDPRTALKEPRTVVINETLARKYFDGVDVVGRNLIINDSLNYKVTGVMKDMPSQSHFHFSMLLPMTENTDSRATDQWLSNNFSTYLVLKPGTDYRKLEPKLESMIAKYVAPLVKSVVNMDMSTFRKSGNELKFSLTPLTSIHLHSNKEAELEANGSVMYVYIFSAIAAFILLIACVNFMNLSTARSANRAKEVGVRKVLGSLRGHLISQFMMESMLISFISMLLALGLAYLLLPLFSSMAAKDMSIGLFSRSWLLPSMLLLVVVVGLLAGSYPAFFLSAFKPIAVLKGNLSAGMKTGMLRNVLVVFQFGISIFLMVGTVVIYNQLSYIRNKKLGFNREHVLVLNNTYPMGSRSKAFKEDILKMPGVQGATMTGFLPTSGNRTDNSYFLSTDLDPKRAISMQNWPVDDQYIPVLGMEMAEGRNFSKEFLTDSSGVIINEAAAKLIGQKDIIGAKIYDLLDINTKQLRTWHVVGVVKDFNYSSLREVVTPVMLYLRENRGNMALRVNSANITSLVDRIQTKWRDMAPGQPFSYTFMDDDFNKIYQSEQRMGSISLSFSMLAICIACLGLFGLAAYAAEQRTREIGIRKVLGATVTNIVGLLSKDFLRLVLISALIAFPFAWWAMHSWLQDFAYRISIGWEVFLLAGVLSASIALLTVSFQAVKAALTTPMKSLRSE